MWAEDDLGSSAPPCLASSIEPIDGNVYRMYHGTSREAAEKIKVSGFKQSSNGMLGPGVYLTRDLQKASKYPLELCENQRVVLRVKVNVGKVKKIDRQGHPLQKTWHDHGYDTAWCPPNCGMVPSGLEEDCVWDPNRITIIGEIRPKVQGAYGVFIRSDIRGANMWAEDDLGSSAPPCLASSIEPIDGNVYRMYHGTSREAAEKIKVSGFKQSSNGMLGPGVYLTRDLQKASKYPLELCENQRVVLRVKVNVGKVKKIDRQGHPLQKTWHDHGYDTAWCPPNCGMVPSGLEEDCVWDPNRITIIGEIRPKVQGAYGVFIRSDIRGANMWAEDDLGSSAPPCLASSIEPIDGNVYRMYHGTSREAAEKIKVSGFKQSSNGMLGPGVYLTRDLQKASKYPLELCENQRVVLRVKVNVGKVKKIDRQGHPLQKTWHDHGYDTAWCPPNCGMVPSGLEEDCVWDPNRITIIGEIRPKVQGAYGVFIRSDIRGANMWAEDDLGSSAPPCLASSIEPIDGNVYRMYHGTSREAAEKIKVSGFKQSSNGMLGPGVYLTRDLQKASKYPLELCENQRVVLRVKVNVGKVKKIDRQGHPLQKTWHDHGYDTAWCPPNCGMVPSGLEEDCVWDPNRITIIGEIRPKM